MPETQAEQKGAPELTIEFWQKRPHNCTIKEAQAQVDKYRQQQDEQNSATQDVTA